MLGLCIPRVFMFTADRRNVVRAKAERPRGPGLAKRRTDMSIELQQVNK